MLQGLGETIAKKPVMTAIPTIVGPSVTITERAATRALSMLAAKGQPDGMLRVFVVGGGCSGYQYGMAIASKAEAEDFVIEAEGVHIVVDRESTPMISGAEIDYVEDLLRFGRKIFRSYIGWWCWG